MAKKIIIVGGGVIGTSIAWHLAKAEAGDITLVERDRLGAGTTWHSAGNITWMANSDRHIRAVFDAIDEVAKEAEQETGWLRTGRLYLARTAETLAWMERQAPIAEAAGFESRLIEPRDAVALNPLIDPGVLLGTWLIGASGRVNPADLTAAYARAARRRGVTLRENCAVGAVRASGSDVTGLATSDGDLDADVVIVACGLWSRRLLAPLGIKLAQWGCEHFYIIQRTDPPLPRTMPSFVSPDDSIYGREEVGGLLFGCFDTDALPLHLDNGAPPDGFAFSLLDENWDQFGPYGERAVRLFPQLQDAPVHRFVNGPETFTPDGEPLLGPLESIDGLYVASAFNSGGVTYSAYAGQLMADLVTGSTPRFDPDPCDPKRFGDKADDEAWLAKRLRYTGRPLPRAPHLIETTIALVARPAPSSAVFNHLFPLRREPPMKNWQAILIAGAMIAAAVIIRFDVDPVRPAHAGIFNEQVSNCILDAAKGGVGLGAGADLLRSACESLYPGG